MPARPEPWPPAQLLDSPDTFLLAQIGQRQSRHRHTWPCSQGLPTPLMPAVRLRVGIGRAQGGPACGTGRGLSQGPGLRPALGIFPHLPCVSGARRRFRCRTAALNLGSVGCPRRGAAPWGRPWFLGDSVRGESMYTCLEPGKGFYLCNERKGLQMKPSPKQPKGVWGHCFCISIR